MYTVNCIVLCSMKPAVVLTYPACATLDRLEDSQSRIIYDYSEKPSSMVTTLCDEEDQVFWQCITMFTRLVYISAFLSVNGSSSSAPGETIQILHFVLRHVIANTP